LVDLSIVYAMAIVAEGRAKHRREKNNKKKNVSDVSASVSRQRGGECKRRKRTTFTLSLSSEFLHQGDWLHFITLLEPVNCEDSEYKDDYGINDKK
jgi:hypothetical protein